MKRIITIVVALLFSFLASAQEGTWTGKLEAQGKKLTVVFHLDGDEPTVDSPDQAAKGIPIQVERNEMGKITIRIPLLSASYEGLWLGKQIICPVLAINGTKDIQVASESNLGALRSGLPANPKNRIEAIEGANHLFQHCTTGDIAEYRQIEETIAPEVLELMIDWLSDFK